MIVLPDLKQQLPSEYVDLGAAIIFFSLAIYGLHSGKLSGCRCWIYRAKEPKLFWSCLVLYFLIGLFCIGHIFSILD